MISTCWRILLTTQNQSTRQHDGGWLAWFDMNPDGSLSSCPLAYPAQTRVSKTHIRERLIAQMKTDHPSGCQSLIHRRARFLTYQALRDVLSPEYDTTSLNRLSPSGLPYRAPDERVMPVHRLSPSVYAWA